MTTVIKVVPPEGPLRATVTVPGSKSIANRALVCALLAGSRSSISHLPDGDDTASLLNVISACGVLRWTSQGTVTVSPGGASRLPPLIDAGLAGTTSRFLTAVACLAPVPVVVDGADPLRRRPMGPLHQALQELGAHVVALGALGHLPVEVGGAPMTGGQVSVKADVSSQFVSALMMIGPILPRGLQIRLSGGVVSRSYIEMTSAIMTQFHARLEFTDRAIVIAPSGYRGAEVAIEADFSSASFPVCAVLIRGGTVRLTNVPEASIQGDRRILDIARLMGATVQFDASGAVVSHEPAGRPRALEIDLRDESDLVLPLAVACSVAEGTSRLSGIGFIRAKESDRLAATAEQLNMCGARVSIGDDDLVIEGVQTLRPGRVRTHHDHRIAMAMALAALSSGRMDIEDPDVVSKSWPTYFTDLTSILGHAETAN